MADRVPVRSKDDVDGDRQRDEGKEEEEEEEQTGTCSCCDDCKAPGVVVDAAVVTATDTVGGRVTPAESLGTSGIVGVRAALASTLAPSLGRSVAGGFVRSHLASISRSVLPKDRSANVTPDSGRFVQVDTSDWLGRGGGISS
jgi:hypothetical protein